MLTVRGDGAKTGQTRHVPLNSQAAQVLQAWKPAALESDWCVFGGSKLTTPLVAIKKGWAAVLKAAKITGFRFHAQGSRRQRPRARARGARIAASSQSRHVGSI